MTESRWRTLIEVADTGSIRAAAARLVVTESAVSAAVGSLAREVGVPLLERAGRGIQLTPAGLHYADYLRRVLGLLEEGAVRARGELDPERGVLRLGCVATLADRMVPQLLGAFRRRHPGVEMRLEVGSSAEVWTQLADHRLDAVMAGRPPEVDDVMVRAQYPNELLVVGVADVVAAFDPAVTTWLMRENGSGTRTYAEAVRSRLAMTGPTMTLGSNGAVIAGAEAGLGVTLVARYAVDGLFAAGNLVELSLPGLPLERPWYLTTRTSPSPTTRMFVDFVLDGQEGAPGWRRASLGSTAVASAGR